jgi:hypothetical protein
MSLEYDYWFVGYKKKDKWETIIIPQTLKKDITENFLLGLNEVYDIVYLEVIDGLKKERFKFKKGEFKKL